MRPFRVFRGGGEMIWHPRSGADGDRHGVKSGKVHGIIEANVEDVLSFPIP